MTIEEMAENREKIVNTTFLIVEFSGFVFFSALIGWLYYALTHQAPNPSEQQFDNNFVPFVLLFMLFAAAFFFGIGFLIHFSVTMIKKLKEKRSAAKHFG